MAWKEDCEQGKHERFAGLHDISEDADDGLKSQTNDNNRCTAFSHDNGFEMSPLNMSKSAVHFHNQASPAQLYYNRVGGRKRATRRWSFRVFVR